MDAPADPWGSTVLVTAPPFSGRDAHAELLPDATTAIVGVTVTRGPDRWLREHHDELPQRVALVDVGGETRSSVPAVPDAGDPDVAVRPVPDRSNLTRLGVAITRCVESVEGARAALCVGALAPLYQFADDRTVYRFLHTLTDLAASADLAAHYHLVPEAVDDRTLARVRSLVDEEVRVGRDPEPA